MIVNLKFFYEKSNTDYEKYNKLWKDNINNINFLHTNLPLKKQLISIIADIDNNKNILGVRFPTINILNNKIINNILLGKGVTYNKTQIWYPKEIWIYNSV